MAATTIGAVRAGDEVRSVLSDGSLGFSTVYVVAHRQLNTSMRHVELRLASANRTVRASHEHLLPLARGGLAACAADAAAQRLLPAGVGLIWTTPCRQTLGETLINTHCLAPTGRVLHFFLSAATASAAVPIAV